MNAPHPEPFFIRSHIVSNPLAAVLEVTLPVALILHRAPRVQDRVSFRGHHMYRRIGKVWQPPRVVAIKVSTDDMPDILGREAQLLDLTNRGERWIRLSVQQQPVRETETAQIRHVLRAEPAVHENQLLSSLDQHAQARSRAQFWDEDRREARMKRSTVQVVNLQLHLRLSRPGTHAT